MTPFEAIRGLYGEQIKPLLNDQGVPGADKRRLACKYVYCMTKARSSKPSEVKKMRGRYKGLVTLIERVKGGNL